MVKKIILEITKKVWYNKNMIKFAKLLDKVVFKKSYGYKYHSFRGGNSLFKSKEVEKVDFCVADNLLKNMTIKTDEDFALAFSALNLIGANAKQDKFNKSSTNHSAYFKRRFHLYRVLATAVTENANIKINMVKDAYNNTDNVTIVNIGNIQFSYHINCESVIEFCKNNNIDIIDGNLEWDSRFRMQNGGKELFEFCLHLKNTSKTLTGEKPLEYVEFLRKQYYLDENKIDEDFNVNLKTVKLEDFVKKIEENYERIM